jgi:hypothetical protein
MDERSAGKYFSSLRVGMIMLKIGFEAIVITPLRANCGAPAFLSQGGKDYLVDSETGAIQRF